MPFFRFHFVEDRSLVGISREMTDRLQEAIGCPRDHIVLENIHSAFIEEGEVKETNNWPFVEVDYFERPRDMQVKVAKVIYEGLKAVGYPHSDIHFRYLQPMNYYEDGDVLGHGSFI